jgi:hypothetical protein
MTGVETSFTTSIDTFTTSQPVFTWHQTKNAIAYAVEIGADSLFVKPFISVPLEDTTYAVPKPIAPGRYFLRIGCNFDDRSPFYFSNWHPFVIQ